MDPETKQLLITNLEIAKENKEMLEKLVRIQKLNQIMRFVYWGIIVLSAVGAYYYIQPYISNLLNVYTGGISSFTNIDDIKNSLGGSNIDQMKDLLKSLNN